jgi:hypothetical protein
MVAPMCALACGDSATSSSSLSASASATNPTTEAMTLSGSSGGASDGSSSGGSGGQSVTGDVSTGAADSTGAVDPTGGGTKFDVGTSKDLGPGECLQMCGTADFSYIWIANSTQSTVSKINTRTLVEEGRYLTRPDGAGNPSRTSVSVDGRAVAVANRNGGVVKIWARPDDCKGANTSTGADDIKPWGTDDCVAWYTEFADARSQRPVAWTTGVRNEVTCAWEDQKIWTAEGRGPGVMPGGYCQDDKVYVHRLNGDTGAIEDTVVLPYPCTTFGVYGGAVDSTNDLWLTRLFEGSPGALRVDFETLEVEEVPPFYGYGITVDHNGRIWGGTGIPGRWDPIAKLWQTIDGSIENYGVGLAEDQQGRMWVGIKAGIQAVDVETLALGPAVMFDGETIQSKGISVDVDGYIWAIPDNADRAYRVDPNDLGYVKIGGLIGAYTYSDMTGGSLKSVACNPPG